MHGELLKLGIDISQAAVSKYMIRHRKPPSQGWRTFLDNHIGDLVSIDFFTVPTVTLRVLFIFVVLAHDRRWVIHFNVAESPTARWTAQQIVEAFPRDTAPRYLPRDRDGIYGHEFASRVDHMALPHAFVAGAGLPGTEEGGAAGPRQDRRVPDGWRASSPLLTAGCLVSSAIQNALLNWPET